MTHLIPKQGVVTAQVKYDKIKLAPNDIQILRYILATIDLKIIWANKLTPVTCEIVIILILLATKIEVITKTEAWSSLRQRTRKEKLMKSIYISDYLHMCVNPKYLFFPIFFSQTIDDSSKRIRHYSPRASSGWTRHLTVLFMTSLSKFSCNATTSKSPKLTTNRSNVSLSN